MEKVIEALKGSSIVKMELLDNIEIVKETITLGELAKRKIEYADKLNSLHSSLYGMQTVKINTLKDLHKRIVALQYNMLLIKLRIAILNVGIPDKGYNGIYASIFQSADLSATLKPFIHINNDLALNHRKTTDEEEARKYLTEQITTYKAIIKEHRKVQLDYNKAIIIEIELYKID